MAIVNLHLWVAIAYFKNALSTRNEVDHKKTIKRSERQEPIVENRRV